jgi:hypothetical protein
MFRCRFAPRKCPKYSYIFRTIRPCYLSGWTVASGTLTLVPTPADDGSPCKELRRHGRNGAISALDAVLASVKKTIARPFRSIGPALQPQPLPHYALTCCAKLRVADSSGNLRTFRTVGRCGEVERDGTCEFQHLTTGLADSLAVILPSEPCRLFTCSARRSLCWTSSRGFPWLLLRSARPTDCCGFLRSSG